MISRNFSDELLIELTKNLEEKTFNPNEIIYDTTFG